MANNCGYTMKAVAKSREALERLISIMQYKDKEFYIYRCFEAYADKIQEEQYNKETFYSVIITGDVAWSCTEWFNSVEVPDRKLEAKDNPDAHFISVDLLCEKLSIGVEVYSEESGCCFQEYYLVNHKGEIMYRDCVEWTQDWCDENGNELDDPIETGGFDDYCNFCDAHEIY